MINNETSERALSVEVFESTFEMWWPKLEESINLTLKEKISDSNFKTRSDRDIMEEILQLVRVANLNKEKFSEGEYFFYPQFVTDLCHNYFAISSHFLKITGRKSSADLYIIYGLFQSLTRRIGFIISSTKYFANDIKKELENTLSEKEKIFDSLRKESLTLLPDSSS